MKVINKLNSVSPMKNLPRALLGAMLGLMLASSAAAQAPAPFGEADILGVWQLTKFVISDGQSELDWCEGATGTIAYLPGQMTVAINCETSRAGSGAEQLGGRLFYAGPFEVDVATGEVIHRVRNYSHPSLNKVYRRSIEMDHADHLRLVGGLGNGQEVIVEWERREAFAYDDQAVTGVWQLIGSENEVPGSDRTIPFCSGFHGSLLYTPGGYVAVAINCGPKTPGAGEEPADQFGRSYFYSGTYDILGSTMQHNPENASVVDQIGRPAARAMTLADERLTLSGTNGSRFAAIWQKRHSFVGLDR